MFSIGEEDEVLDLLKIVERGVDDDDESVNRHGLYVSNDTE